MHTAQCRPRLWIVFTALFGSLCVAVHGAPPSRPLDMTPSAEAGLPVDLNASTMEQKGDLVILRDNVRILQGSQSLSANYVQYNRETGDAYARGAVVFVRSDGSVWRGEELAYNFNTGVGGFGGFEYTTGPFRIFGSESTAETANLIRVKDVSVTTCEGDPPWEFEVQMQEATLKDRRYLSGRNAVIYLGPVPVMWVPWYRRDLQSAKRWDILPGYSSRLGPYLIVHYNYGITADRDTVRGVTGVNWYGDRGVGIEQQFLWAQPKRPGREWYGGWENFYIQDQRLYRDDREKAERQDFLDSDTRYKVRVRHTQMFEDRQWFSADGTYLSDPYVNLDFFRKEYRQSPQPENRATYQYRGDEFNASVQLNGRLNDFYENVDRLPEARLGVSPIEMGDSGVYYESESTASFLRREYPSTSDNQGYNSGRVDTYQMLSYPGRYLGFLNFVPRAGYRGTFYSTTREPDLVTTNSVTMTDAMGNPFTTNVVSHALVEGGADARHLPELGFEVSFKAFGVWDEGPNQWGQGYRHVVEPYSDYQWNPEPALRPSNILQFDSIDKIDRDHRVAFGIRNKIQTRRQSGSYIHYSNFESYTDMEGISDSMDASSLVDLPPSGGFVTHDLLRMDISTFCRVQKYPEQSTMGPVALDLELRPGTRVRWRTRASYDIDAQQIARVENQFSMRSSSFSTFTLEHLYRPDARNMMAVMLDLYPKAKWSLQLYERYDFQNSRPEEHSILFRHRMSCIGWGIGASLEQGYDGRNDEVRVWGQIWLLKLPGSDLKIGG